MEKPGAVDLRLSMLIAEDALETTRQFISRSAESGPEASVETGLAEAWRRRGMNRDIIDGLRAAHVWGTLGLHDIRQRYRRSVLGPLWYTLSTLIMVSVLGFLYATLLQQDASNYVPFLGVGLVVWQFLASVANDGCTAFTSVDFLIKQVRLPLTIHVAREVWRNFLILVHNLPVVILLLIAFGKTPNWGFVLLPFGFCALLLNGVWIGIVLGILCTRFRDVPPIVSNLMQVAFFLTPVMWSPEILADRSWVAEYNPFYHVIEVVRAPLLGRNVDPQSWLWVGGILLAGFAAAQFLMNRYRSRVPYWL